MKPDDEKPSFLMGRAGLVFAYVCFALSLATIGAAIALLPLDLKVKIFLGLAALVLSAMFVFMAIATHLVMRPPAGSTTPRDGVLKDPERSKSQKPRAKPPENEGLTGETDADCSHRTR